MNKVKVLFFATLKEKLGFRETELEIPDGILVSEFIKLLIEKYPALPKTRAGTVVAINQEFAFDNQTIPSGAEIALFPPVSGG